MLRLLFIMGLLWASPAAAEDWVWVSRHEGGNNYLDRSSVKVEDQLTFASIKAVPSDGPIEYYIFNRVYDCERRADALAGGTIAYRDGRRESDTVPRGKWRFSKSPAGKTAGASDLEMVCQTIR